MTSSSHHLLQVGIGTSEDSESIYKEQKTVDLQKKENTTLRIEGRHDPAIVHRAAPVVCAVTALAAADLLTVRYGTDALKKGF